jgi:type I restriction enzyme R subunit
MPFVDPDLERLYTFGRFLELKLPQDPKKAPLKLDAETALTYYRLDKMGEGGIALKPGEDSALKSASETGTKRSAAEEVRLSEVIEVLNERFGTEFTEADQLFFDSVIAEAKADAEVQQRAAANSLDNFSLAMKDRLRNAIVDRMDKNEAIATRYLNEQDFEEVAYRALVKRIYEDLRAKASEA